MSYEEKENIPEQLLKAILELNSMIIMGLSVLEYNLRESMIQVFVSNIGPNWLTRTIAESAIPIFKIEAFIIERRQGKHFSLTEKKFAEEAGLGFWVELFNRESYKKLKGIPIQAIRYRPSDLKRSRIYQTLRDLKNLRNQLVHNRISLSSRKEIVFILETLQKANNDIRAMVSYINPTATNLLPQEIDRKISDVEKLF